MARLLLLLATLLAAAVQAFPLCARAIPATTHPSRRALPPVMGMEELEFIIHADGRVEERVRGIKGQDCSAVTQEINKQLGEVYESKPTEEMFEQKVELTVDVEASVNVEGGGQSGGWGQTSW
eukprot:2630658-Prymnesium_polylepis.1